MKLLFITDNFPPEVNAPATRTYEHCIEWQKKGIDVTVITCAPNFPKGQVFDGYKNKLYQKEIIDGIKVIRVWSYIAANAGFAKRILDFISFSFSAFWVSLFIKTDVIIATSPQFFTTFAAYPLSVLKRKPWVFEVRDLWPESIKAVGAMSEDSKVFRLLEKIELFLYRKSSKVITVTNAFKENLISRGIDLNKIEVVRNGSNIELFQPIPKSETLLSKYNLTGKFVLGYVGTHGMAHKLDFILNSWKKAPEKAFLLFIGDGAEKSNLIELAKKEQLENVLFLDSVPKHEVKNYLSIIDCALVPLKKSDTFKTVIPSKIFENSAMQIPILLGVEGESEQIIKEFGAGLCFEPENEESFIDNLKKLVNDKELYNECKTGCSKLAIEFDRSKMAVKMLKVLQSLTK